MAQSVVVLISRSPYGREDAFAGMRQSLAFLVSGQIDRTVTILIGEGTLNAVSIQRSEALGMPSNAAALSDLVEMEGEVYVIKEDLERLGANLPIVEGVTTIDWIKAREIISSCQLVNTF